MLSKTRVLDLRSALMTDHENNEIVVDLLAQAGRNFPYTVTVQWCVDYDAKTATFETREEADLQFGFALGYVCMDWAHGNKCEHEVRHFFGQPHRGGDFEDAPRAVKVETPTVYEAPKDVAFKSNITFKAPLTRDAVWLDEDGEKEVVTINMDRLQELTRDYLKNWNHSASSLRNSLGFVGNSMVLHDYLTTMYEYLDGGKMPQHACNTFKAMMNSSDLASKTWADRMKSEIVTLH